VLSCRTSEAEALESAAKPVITCERTRTTSWRRRSRRCRLDASSSVRSTHRQQLSQPFGDPLSPGLVELKESIQPGRHVLQVILLDVGAAGLLRGEVFSLQPLGGQLLSSVAVNAPRYVGQGWRRIRHGASAARPTRGIEDRRVKLGSVMPGAS